MTQSAGKSVDKARREESEGDGLKPILTGTYVYETQWQVCTLVGWPCMNVDVDGWVCMCRVKIQGPTAYHNHVVESDQPNQKIPTAH